MSPERTSRATRTLGAIVGGGFLILGVAELVAGLRASVWTILMPVLGLTLVSLTILNASRQDPVPAHNDT
jgi:hypothetical protein